MGFTYTDSTKTVLEAWGKFKVTLMEAVVPGSLLSFYNTDNDYTVQIADESDSQRADCIALEAGAIGAEITAALKAVFRTVDTVGTGGVVTQVYFAAADDFFGAPLYLGEDGKPESSVGDTYKQEIGKLISRNRVLIDLTALDTLGNTTVLARAKLYFGDTNHWIAQDAGATLSVNALVYFHIKILGNTEYIFTKDTLEMNANTITECGHIYFNNGAMIQQAAAKLTIYGGYASGDVLELFGSTNHTTPKITITDNDRILVTGDMAITGGIQGVGGAAVFNGSVALNGDVLVATTKKIQFKDTGSFIEKGAAAHMNITSDGELVITATAIYLSGGHVTIAATKRLYFGSVTVYMAATAAGKLHIYCGSTAADAFKIGTGAGGGIQLDTWLRLFRSSNVASVEGQIWYDDATNTIHFWDGSQERTVTSS